MYKSWYYFPQIINTVPFTTMWPRQMGGWHLGKTFSILLWILFPLIWSIVSNNALAVKRWQAMVWTMDALYTVLGFHGQVGKSSDHKYGKWKYKICKSCNKPWFSKASNTSHKINHCRGVLWLDTISGILNCVKTIKSDCDVMVC